MGYGVNRKAKKWPGSSGRVRRAAKRRKPASTRKRTRTRKKASSARPVRTSSRRRAAPTPKAPKARKARKARLYTRYNPLDGTKAKVTASDPRFAAWLSRKPGKKKIRQERAAELLGGSRVGGVIAEEVARKAATSAGRIGTGALRGVAAKAAGPALAALAGLGATQTAILAGAGAVSFFLTRWIKDSLGKSYEDREQAALSAFVAARNKLVRDLGARDWSHVPAGQKRSLVEAYKTALAQIRAPRVLEK